MYECPFCASRAKPKIIGYFLPKIVKCAKCKGVNFEREFIPFFRNKTKKILQVNSIQG